MFSPKFQIKSRNSCFKIRKHLRQATKTFFKFRNFKITGTKTGKLTKRNKLIPTFYFASAVLQEHLKLKPLKTNRLKCGLSIFTDSLGHSNSTGFYQKSSLSPLCHNSEIGPNEKSCRDFDWSHKFHLQKKIIHEIFKPNSCDQYGRLHTSKFLGKFLQLLFLFNRASNLRKTDSVDKTGT